MVEAPTVLVNTDRWIALAGRVIGLHPKDRFIEEAISAVEYTVQGRILPPKEVTRALEIFTQTKERPLLEHLGVLARMPDRTLVIPFIKEWFDGCSLTGRDKRTTGLRLGLNLYDADQGLDPMTLEQIGSDFGVTRERARQYIVKACTKLKIGLVLELDSAKPFLEYLQG